MKSIGIKVAGVLRSFFEDEVLPGTGVASDAFWTGVAALVRDLAPRNRELLDLRDELQRRIDSYHRGSAGKQFDAAGYERFLLEIGYIWAEPEDFCIRTDNVDDEIARIAGPQLVVPVSNARYALNAANARWALAVAIGIGVTAQERMLRVGSARAADDFDLVIGAAGAPTQRCRRGAACVRRCRARLPGSRHHGGLRVAMGPDRAGRGPSVRAEGRSRRGRGRPAVESARRSRPRTRRPARIAPVKRTRTKPAIATRARATRSWVVCPVSARPAVRSGFGCDPHGQALHRRASRSRASPCDQSPAASRTCATSSLAAAGAAPDRSVPPCSGARARRDSSPHRVRQIARPRRRLKPTDLIMSAGCRARSTAPISTEPICLIRLAPAAPSGDGPLPIARGERLSLWCGQSPRIGDHLGTRRNAAQAICADLDLPFPGYVFPTTSAQ